ncbi:MAG: phosphodiesterase [Candidatus Coprovivens sp.]
MKIIIASDIHGSLKYTKKLEELIEKEKTNKIILLGDLLYHGARNQLPEEYNTMEVANILNKYKDIIIAVRGNCDSEVDDMVTEFDTRSDYKEIDIEGIKFILTHGHLNPWLIDIIKDNYVLQGHTHVYNLDGKVLNPGSVGIPKTNPEHTCLLYENKEFKLIDLDNNNIISIKKVG